MVDRPGFLRYTRKDPGYRSGEDRTRDFKAVELELDEAELLLQATRCMECGTPFCHGYGCPLANNIPEMNELVTQQRWQEAAELLLATNNFPEFTARLCPAPCEAACVLGINDQATTIRQVEKAIIEKAYQDEYIMPHAPSRRNGKRVGVIGSGPAGLAVADTLNRKGYSVVVFDSAKRAGGVLRYGIPDFKLEKWVLDRRIELMTREGITFELKTTVGRDVSWHYLESRFDTTCLCIGSREPRDLQIPGRELGGIHFAMEYLVAQNRMNAGEIESIENELDAKDRRVVVIGGGDTGADCVGTAARQGARAIMQLEIMPEPPELRPEQTPWPTWPNVLRASSSHGEGCERRWSVNTKEFVGNNGKLASLHCCETKCGRDEDGRSAFEEIDGTDFEVDAELTLLALGFVGPGPNPITDKLGVVKDNRGNIKTNDNHMTNIKGLFAAGDAAQGQSLIVSAIADGRNAANGIEQFLAK